MLHYIRRPSPLRDPIPPSSSYLRPHAITLTYNTYNRD